MRKRGGKRKASSKSGRKGASSSSASKNDDANVETSPQETQPTQEEREEAADKVESPAAKEEGENKEEAAKVESPAAKEEGENEEEAAKVESPATKEEEENEEEAAKVESPAAKEEGENKEEAEDEQPEQEKDASETDKKAATTGGASASEQTSGYSTRPIRKRPRIVRSPENSPATSSTKRARVTKSNEKEPEYFKEQRSLEDLWKAVFPVGTEWGQQDELYESNWDFTNLEAALEEGGQLYGRKVYVFGCAESQVVPYNNENKTVLVPTVICVESTIPPSDKIGITSLNSSEAEEIIPMKQMKMAWIPYVPLEKRDRQVDRKDFQIHILSCTQRRSALKHLKDDRVKKFNHCLPYINNPFKENESEKSTKIEITFSTEPPLVREYDWEKNNLDDFTNDLIIDEALHMDRKDEFMESVNAQCESVQKANAEAKQARDKAKEELSEGTKVAYQEMRLYKFYPLPSPDTPDLSGINKSPFINKYFGMAHEVL